MKSNKSNIPNFKNIGKRFKSIAFSIGLYFFVILIKNVLIPNIFNENTENPYKLFREFEIINYVTYLFFTFMVFNIIIQLKKIGDEFMGEKESYNPFFAENTPQKPTVINIENTCPACQSEIKPNDKECSSCGLYIN